MHKLWPHSVKNNSKNASSNSKAAALDSKSKENQSTSSSSNNSNNQNEKSVSVDKNANADVATSQSEFNQSSNPKTPMCLINELVKYNKVIFVLFSYIKIGVFFDKTTKHQN